MWSDRSSYALSSYSSKCRSSCERLLRNTSQRDHAPREGAADHPPGAEVGIWRRSAYAHVFLFGLATESRLTGFRKLNPVERVRSAVPAPRPSYLHICCREHSRIAAEGYHTLRTLGSICHVSGARFGNGASPCRISRPKFPNLRTVYNLPSTG